METFPIRIDRAGARSLPDVLGLLAEHMPDADVAARWTWMYEKNPHGRALTVLAYDARSQEAIGVASVFPRRLITGGRVFMGAIGGDAYVRLKARRRGVATAMHQALLERMHNEGVDVMFGPPEANNLRALERAGSRVITTARRYVRPGWVHAALRPLSRLRSHHDVRLEPIDKEDRRVDTLFDRSMDPSLVAVVRDAAFFRWRYVENPSLVQQAFVVTHDRRAIGICVLERKDKRVAIVDLLAPVDAYGQVLAAALGAFDATSFVVQLNERGPFVEEVIRLGLWPREGKAFQVLATKNCPSNAFDASRWYYTWGDGDLDRVL